MEPRRGAAGGEGGGQAHSKAEVDIFLPKLFDILPPFINDRRIRIGQKLNFTNTNN